MKLTFLNNNTFLFGRLEKLNQNDGNIYRGDCRFARSDFGGDRHRLASLVEVNDSLIDRIVISKCFANCHLCLLTFYLQIHCREVIKSEPLGSTSDLVQVQLNLNKKKPSIVIKDFDQKPNHLKRTLSATVEEPSPAKRVRFLASSGIPRPQVVYKIKVDNSHSKPFIPRLTQKPNAKVPLEQSVTPIAIEKVKAVSKKDISSPEHYYPHPYQPEIENFEVELDFYNESKEDIKVI